MFWWIVGGTLAVCCIPVLIAIIAAIVNPSRRKAAPSVPQEPQQRPINIQVQPVEIKPRHKITVYSTLERNAQENKSRRDSINRRYNREYPW